MHALFNAKINIDYILKSLDFLVLSTLLVFRFCFKSVFQSKFVRPPPLSLTWLVTWSCKMARKCDVLLEENFSLFPFKNTNYAVELTQRWISYKNTRNSYEEKHYILFGDVTGCRCRKSKTYDVSSCFLTIYHYPMCQKSQKGKRSREKHAVTFDIHRSDNFDENLQICHRWRNLIMSMSRSSIVHKEGTCQLLYTSGHDSFMIYTDYIS